MEKQKILVVDDDKHIAELISLYMMKEGSDAPRNGRLSGLHRGA